MVSDFIDEHNGFLRLSSEELEGARKTDRKFPQEARELFEYGAARAGYWTGEKFMRQIETECKLAEYKYPSSTHTLVWLFDQSSCHKAYAPDALNVNNMNVKPGGAQAVMRDTVLSSILHIFTLMAINVYSLLVRHWLETQVMEPANCSTKRNGVKVLQVLVGGGRRGRV